MDEEKQLIELYKAGMCTGIRRCVGSQITEMFRRLWLYEQDRLLSLDLQLIAASECWPFFVGACKIGEDATKKIKKDPKNAALDVFKYLKVLAAREGDRSAYYLAMAVQEPWFEINGQGRAVARKQYKIVEEAVRAYEEGTQAKYWQSMVAAANQKNSKIITGFVQAAGKTALMAEKKWDKTLAAAVAALALTEPKITPTDKAARIIEFKRADELTWNSVHPDTTIGQKAYSNTAQRLGMERDVVRLSWLGCYVDRDIFARDCFWGTIYTRQLQGQVNDEKWHHMAVQLMTFCQEWFRKNDMHMISHPDYKLSRRDFNTS